MTQVPWNTRLQASSVQRSVLCCAPCGAWHWAGLPASRIGVPALPPLNCNWVNPLFSLGLGFLITKVAIKNHPHLPFRAVVRTQSSYKVTNAYGMQLVLNKSQPFLLSLTNC